MTWKYLEVIKSYLLNNVCGRGGIEQTKAVFEAKEITGTMKEIWLVAYELTSRHGYDFYQHFS